MDESTWITILGLALLGALIACAVLGTAVGQLNGRRTLDKVQLIRCHEERQAALRRNADDKLVRLARMVVGAGLALPPTWPAVDDLRKTIASLNNYLDHLDGKVSR